MNSNEPKKSSLAEQFLKAMEPPSEEEVYKKAINQSLWTIDQFVALIAGITPENFRNETKSSTNISDGAFEKRFNYGHEVFTKFLDYMEKHRTYREFVIADNAMLMSPWKYIKWVAQNEIGMNKRFFDSLPLYLMELFIEFSPPNIALRNAHKSSRSYHKAYYLDRAKKLKEEYPGMTPIEIYRHPIMQNTERYIRELGGNYKKRTIVEAWLPTIIDSPRGRPKKLKKGNK